MGKRSDPCTTLSKHRGGPVLVRGVLVGAVALLVLAAVALADGPEVDDGGVGLDDEVDEGVGDDLDDVDLALAAARQAGRHLVADDEQEVRADLRGACNVAFFFSIRSPA